MNGNEKMIKLKKILNEGVDDPGILKAILLAGGPASGKSFVASQLFGIPQKMTISYTGLKLVNQDQQFEALLKKYGFGTDLDLMPDEVFIDLTHGDIKNLSLRGLAKELTAEKQKLYMNGRLGMIIDGTGHIYSKIAKQKSELEKIGYDTYMIFVNTSLEVAQKRNQARDRILKPEIVKDSWQAVQNNMGKFQGLFGSNFVIVDNSQYLDNPEKYFEPLIKQYIRKFVSAPIKNKIGKSWVNKQRILKKK